MWPWPKHKANTTAALEVLLVKVDVSLAENRRPIFESLCMKHLVQDKTSDTSMTGAKEFEKSVQFIMLVSL